MIRVSQRKADDLELAKWVKKVREKYKKVQRGISVPTLSQARIDQLNDIHFVWIVRSSDFNKNFDHHLADLIQFKRENGHTRVPHIYKKNPKLGRWCHHIKLSYKKLANGEKPMIKLEQEHINKLNEIGFQWKIRILVATNREDNQDNFDEWLCKLEAFKSTHGHCNVSHFHDDELACWVSSLKSSYRQIREGKRPIMRLNRKQINQLDGIDFDWTDTPTKTLLVSNNNNTLSWNERYKQLCEYKQRYGNCRVPSKYDDDKAFGNCEFLLHIVIHFLHLFSNISSFYTSS